MSAADKLLPLLDGVKQTGPSRWIARCSAHEDRNPSLSIRETDDGRLLLHCWAGCDVHAIVGAVGLTLADLFPPRGMTHGAGYARERRPWSAGDLLNLAAAEAAVAAVVACDMAHGLVPSEADHERLTEAALRLARMVEAVA